MDNLNTTYAQDLYKNTYIGYVTFNSPMKGQRVHVVAKS